MSEPLNRCSGRASDAAPLSEKDAAMIKVALCSAGPSANPARLAAGLIEAFRLVAEAMAPAASAARPTE